MTIWSSCSRGEVLEEKPRSPGRRGDARTDERPYRRALSVEETLREVNSGAGSRFDPDVVRAFVSPLGELDAAS